MDIFDRIAAAVVALRTGNPTALQQHVAAIDAHLSQLDQSEAGDQTRLSDIEQGLQKVADAVNPPEAPPAAEVASEAAAQPGADQSATEGTAAAAGTQATS